jgi:hypothetical protein
VVVFIVEANFLLQEDELVTLWIGTLPSGPILSSERVYSLLGHFP